MFDLYDVSNNKFNLQISNQIKSKSIDVNQSAPNRLWYNKNDKE